MIAISKEFTCLCKFRGMLVIAVCTLHTDGTKGRCPECGSVEFYDRHGWIECECGFAYSKKNVEEAIRDK